MDNLRSQKAYIFSIIDTATWLRTELKGERLIFMLENGDPIRVTASELTNFLLTLKGNNLNPEPDHTIKPPDLKPGETAYQYVETLPHLSEVKLAPSTLVEPI